MSKKFFATLKSKRFLSILVVALALGLSSFVSLSPKSTALTCDPVYTFVYNGTGSHFLASSYTLNGSFDDAECEDGIDEVCVIYACADFVNVDTEHPANSTLKDEEIAQGGTLGTAITNNIGVIHRIIKSGLNPTWEVVFKDL